jgi:hypothetical protein
MMMLYEQRDLTIHAGRTGQNKTNIIPLRKSAE